GGFVRHDDRVHSGVQLAERLSRGYPFGVHLAVFENHRRERAFRDIMRGLDSKHEGTPTEEEKRSARIVIYGHSWGASETVALARELEKNGVPVLLTVQVDSVPKRRVDDTLIPANVAKAVNFYQSEGLLHGRPRIHAADAARTQILGNFQIDYRKHSV